MTKIVAKHIASLYKEAARIAEEEIDGLEVADRSLNKEVAIRWLEGAMDRIDNLTSHAFEELRDEYLRARDGWPTV